MEFKTILTESGVTEDVAEKVLSKMKESKVYLAGEENLDIRYSKLKQDHESSTSELTQAKALIEEMKKATEGNADATAKIATFEAKVAELTEENERIKLESAVKVALLKENVVDIDYVTFKLREVGDLALDDKGDIKGWDEKLSSLKIQLPTQFTTGAGVKKVDENKLTNPVIGSKSMSQEEFNKLGYSERNKLFESDPETYNLFTAKGNK